MLRLVQNVNISKTYCKSIRMILNMVIEQKAIVGKLKKFPSGIKQLFALGSNFRSCEDANGLFHPFVWKEQINCESLQVKSDKARGAGMKPLSQTYPQWKVMCDVQKLHSLQKRKQFKNRTMYILPLGTLDEKATVESIVNEYQQNGIPDHCSNLLGVVIQFTSLFFHGMEVKLLPFQDIENLDFTMRVHSKTNKKQVLVTDILGYLKKIRPKDSFCVIGWSSLDLYPSPELNFVLGEACFDTGCAVVSFGHYAEVANLNYELLPSQSSNNTTEEEDYPGNEQNNGKAVYNDADDLQNLHGASSASTTPACLSNTQYSEQHWNCTNLGDRVVWRVLKVLTHEVCHVFGMHHCTFFSCLMNESNNVSQAENQPLFLCPVCLRKLQKFLHFPIVMRYEAFYDFMEHYCTFATGEQHLPDICTQSGAAAEFHTHSEHLAGVTAAGGSPGEKKSNYDTNTLDKFRDSSKWLDNVLKCIGKCNT